MAFLLPFADFLDTLRAQGVPVGVGHYQRLGRLLSHWKGTDPRELGSAVAALFARSDEESVRIEQLFRDYCALSASPAPPIKESGAATTLKRTPSSHWIGLSALVLVGLIGVMAVLMMLRDPRHQVIRVDAGTDGQSGSASGQVAPLGERLDAGSTVLDLSPSTPVNQTPQPTHTQTLSPKDPGVFAYVQEAFVAAPKLLPLIVERKGYVAAISVSCLMGFGLGWLFDKRRGRRRATGRLRAKLDALPGPRDYVLNFDAPRSSFTREELDSLALCLERLTLVTPGARVLDVEASLYRSLNGLHPPLAFLPHVRKRTVLVLRDVCQDMGIWNHKIDSFLVGLRERGADVVCYTYVAQPSRLRVQGSVAEAEIDLPELAVRHPDSCLLIVSSGRWAVEPQGHHPATCFSNLSLWSRRAWIHPVSNPALHASELRALTVPIWPMTYRGIFAALSSLRQELSPRTHARTVSLNVTRRQVKRGDVEFLSRVLSAIPQSSPVLAESLRQRFSPDVPDDVLLFLRATSLRPESERLQFSATTGPPLSGREATTLHYLRTLLQRSRPTVGSAAELRWQLDQALLDLRLPDPRHVYHPSALRQLQSLAASPLLEEVEERTDSALPNIPVEIARQLGTISKQTAHGPRNPWVTLATATAAAVLAVIPAIAICLGLLTIETRTDQAQQRLLDTYVERGRQLLFESASPNEALLWLHRAQAKGSKYQYLPDLLHSALHSAGITNAILFGHTGAVQSATYSPDGRRIVTASDDKIARVWEASTGSLLTELKGHSSKVNSATFSPDSRRIVTASDDKTARVWEANSGRLVTELKGHSSKVNSATFSPDGRHIVTASWDQTARVWDSGSGLLVTEFKGHGDNVCRAVYGPDGRHIVTASWDNTARVWDSDSGRLLTELKGHGSRVNSATYSPDGRRIVTASLDKTARVWDADSGHLLAELKDHEESVLSATYRPDGRRILTISLDRTARVWDADSGRLLTKLKDHGSIVLSATYSPDGRHIVTSHEDKTARVWDADSGLLLAELKGHGAIVLNATYSPDGRHIVTASMDHTAIVWGADTGHLLAETRGSVTSATYGLFGARILTTSRDEVARVWDASTGTLLIELKGHVDSVRGARYSPDGRHILTASSDRTARVWGADSGRLLVVFKGHKAEVHSATYSPDGRRILTASSDGTARVWNADGAGGSVVLEGHEADVHSATYSPDGRRILTASSDGTARVWDADSGRLLVVLKGHEADVHDARYSPNGRHILTASRDGTARVWDADSGRLLVVLKGHEADVQSATYSPDGRRILTASMDQTVRVWDANFASVLVLRGHEDGVHSATYSPDGRYILTTSFEDTTRVFDGESGRLLAKLVGHRDRVLSAEYSPDGRRILTASFDATAQVWNVSPETRTPEQIAALIRCSSPVRFRSPESSEIIPVTPDPSACQFDHTGVGERQERSEKDTDGDLANTPKPDMAEDAVNIGTLSKEEIRRVIRSHLNEVKYCEEAGLKGDDGLLGRMMVQIVISPMGTAAKSEIKSSSLHNAKVEQCVMEAVRRWVFPTSSRGLVVIYPFVFKGSATYD